MFTGNQDIDAPLGKVTTATKKKLRKREGGHFDAGALTPPGIILLEMATYPKSLVSSLTRGLVLPFVGAGVSMAVRMRRNGESVTAFPGWIELLRRAAARLSDEGKSVESTLVQANLDLQPPRLLTAAKEAKQHLGPTWYRFLKEQLDPDRRDIEDATLDLARAVWALGSPLVITTNYDRVLQWSCPDLANLRSWHIEAPAGLVELMRGEQKQPTIWHLHGMIDDATRMILTPDGYSQLYPKGKDTEHRYKAALTTLRTQMASRTLLFIGLSFDDKLFGDQLRWVRDTFNGTAGPHYILVRKAEASTMQERVRSIPVELLQFEDFGEPLITCLSQLAEYRHPPPRQPDADNPFDTDPSFVVSREGDGPNLHRARLDATRAAGKLITTIDPGGVNAPGKPRQHQETDRRGARDQTEENGPSLPHTAPDGQASRWLFLFPAVPHISTTIEAAVRGARALQRSGTAALHLVSGHAGQSLAADILGQIDSSTFVVADITNLYFDIALAIGYAIGKSKRVAVIMNVDHSPRDAIRAGVFESIASYPYANSDQLQRFLAAIEQVEPMRFPEITVDRRAPLYVVESVHKTEGSIRTIARIKKARIMFRSFDPSEQSRLLPAEAFRGVAASIGVVALLQRSGTTDVAISNLRAAFVVGLTLALNRKLLLLQEGNDPIREADGSDLVATYKSPHEIDRYISGLAPVVIEALQAMTESNVRQLTGFLAELDLGASAAENEIAKLGSYYVATDHFNKVLDGNARLVVGRKGSGKTALFFQVRNRLRTDKKMIVLDLKPEGHQLKRFKEFVLEFLSEAIQEHVATAFWEYVLLLELCHKLLAKDEQPHVKDHNLYAPYRRLNDLYHDDEFIREGDFSERMLALVQRITTEFREKHREPTGHLSVREVINLIYKHDMPALRSELVSYLKLKHGVWILFDNIDKGWPTRGVEHTDIIILRGLLDATRDIEKLLRRHKLDTRSVVFLRNDVFELLVDDTPDRGKESKESIDWTDPDLLKELLRRRLTYNGFNEKVSFEDAWHRICVSHIDGEDSADYLISRSLMRPRNLLNLANYCRSNAVNLRRQRIEQEDIKKAVAQYSADIGNEIGLEIRDVFPIAGDILYYFIGCEPSLTLAELRSILAKASVPPEAQGRMIDILLWFSFLGVILDGDEDFVEVYSYSVFYDMKKLRRHTGDLADESAQFVIHRAFWPFLDIAG